MSGKNEPRERDLKTTSRGRRSPQFSSTAAVYAALIGDILVALSKIGAAIWTGSAAMTSEAIHSIVDTTNEILLLYGIHRSLQKADADHPFGSAPVRIATNASPSSGVTANWPSGLRWPDASLARNLL